MLATSACDQDRPTLVLFAHIALQVQIILRICFNRGNLSCVFGVRGDLGAPFHMPYRAPLVNQRPKIADVGHPQPMGSQTRKIQLGKVTRLPQLLATGHRTPEL